MALTFGDLNIGDTFDFVDPTDPCHSPSASLLARCTKASMYTYTWPAPGPTAVAVPKRQSRTGYAVIYGATLGAHVGRLIVPVFHVERAS